MNLRYKMGRLIQSWVFNSAINKINPEVDRVRSEWPWPSTTGFKLVSHATQILAGTSGKWFKWDYLIVGHTSNGVLSDTLAFYDGGSGGSALATAFALGLRVQEGGASACGIDTREFNIKGQFIASSLWVSLPIGGAPYGIKVGGTLVDELVK